MKRENYTVEPEWLTPKELAIRCGWPEAKAKFMLEEFLERGLVTCNGEKYKINGRGLAVGEKMGAVVPLEQATGIVASLSAKKVIDTTH